MKRGQTYLPVMIMSRPSSLRDCSPGGADWSFSSIALSSHEITSLGTLLSDAFHSCTGQNECALGVYACWMTHSFLLCYAVGTVCHELSVVASKPLNGTEDCQDPGHRFQDPKNQHLPV